MMEETNNLQNTENVPENVENTPIEETVLPNAKNQSEENTPETPVETAPEPVAEPEPAPENPEPAPEPETKEEPKEEAKEEAEPEPDYTTLTRGELVEAMKTLLAESDVQKIRTRVANLWSRFGELNREEHNRAFEQFIADGGNKDEYEPADDALADEMRSLHDEYRSRRQHYMEQLEEQKKRNLAAKQALIEEMRSLIDSEEEQVKVSLDKFNEILGRLGVEQFGEKGESFDPELHNAVLHTEDETLGENVIAEVMLKGYKKGDKVLRYAMVKVAN